MMNYDPTHNLRIMSFEQDRKYRERHDIYSPPNFAGRALVGLLVLLILACLAVAVFHASLPW